MNGPRYLQETEILWGKELVFWLLLVEHFTVCFVQEITVFSIINISALLIYLEFLCSISWFVNYGYLLIQACTYSIDNLTEVRQM